MNIVSELFTMLSPALVDRIAAALKVSPEVVRKVLGAALPAILAALGSKAESTKGATALWRAVQSTDVDVENALAGALSGPGSGSYIEQGANMLRSLLGGNAFSDITGALDKTAGDIGPRAASSLASLAGQLALGSMSKNSIGMDATDLSALLASQRNNIKAALPPDLGRLLSGAGVVSSSFMDTARVATADISWPSTNTHAKDTAKSGRSWALWLIPLVIIAVLAWHFLSEPQQTPQPGTEVPTAVTELVADGVDVGKQLTTALDGIKSGLGGVTDAATAQVALPKLQEATAAIDGVAGIVGKLSAEQRSRIAMLVSAALPAIKELANKALAAAGVGEIAKPVVDGLIGKLETLANPT